MTLSKLKKIGNLSIPQLLKNYYLSSIRKKGGHIIPYSGTRISIKKSSKIILKANLTLNYKRILASKAETLLYMEEGAQLIVDGAFRFFYSGDILIAKNATLCLGEGYANSGVQIRCIEHITIGKGVAIGNNVVIMDSDHHGLHYRGVTRESSLPIRIEDNVWIGREATILKGVTVGKGAVVAAGSIVTKDVPAGCIVAGIPAKIIEKNVVWTL